MKGLAQSPDLSHSLSGRGGAGEHTGEEKGTQSLGIPHSTPCTKRQGAPCTLREGSTNLLLCSSHKEDRFLPQRRGEMEEMAPHTEKI